MILIAIPTKTNVVSTEWCANFYKMGFPLGVRGTLMFYNRSTLDIGATRDEIVKKFMANKQFTRLFFIDSDVILPSSSLIYLFEADKDIVTGIYYSKMEPSVPVIFKKIGDGSYMKYPEEQVFEIEAAGLGCCLIKREVFEEFDKAGISPYFMLEPLSTRQFQGEDFYFFERCKKLGIKAYADSRVQCGHQKDFDGTKIYYRGGLMGDDGS